MCSEVSWGKFESSLSSAIDFTGVENKTIILSKIEQLVSGRSGTIILIAW